MAGIGSHCTVLILTANLFVLSTCLDIHYPEYARAASTYGYLPDTQPAQHQIYYGQPQQNGMFYQGQALDENYHQQADYHRALSQQNYGHMTRRSSPQATFRQSPCSRRFEHQQNPYRCYRSIPAPTNFPLYSLCNVHNDPTADDNQDAGSIPIRGRDSRSAVEPSKKQSRDDVATSPPMMVPIYLSTNFDDIKNKRAAQKPPTAFYDRLNKVKNSTGIKQKILTENFDKFAIDQPPSTKLASTIVVPSRMFVNPNIKPESDVSQVRDSSIDYPSEDYSNCAGGAFGQFNRTKIIGNGRLSESNRERIYQSGYPEFSKFLGQRKISGISPVSPIYTEPSTVKDVQQPISNNGAKIDDNSYNPYEYFKSRSTTSFPPEPTPVTTNNSKPYPIYIPNIARNDSIKYSQVPTSH